MTRRTGLLLSIAAIVALALVFWVAVSVRNGDITVEVRLVPPGGR